MLAPLAEGDPQAVGTYRLHGRLGAGGMGAVYLAFEADDRPVAIKVIRPDLAADPDFRARFRREVAAACRVRGRFVAEVLAADVEAGRPWMAMEYVDGVSLARAVAEQGCLAGPRLVAFAAGLASALAAVHEVGLAHRDLKPANILLAGAGLKVIDFGIARALDETAYTRTGEILGTVAWMAPEQLLGERVGSPADVFAWALCVAFAATGRRLFAGPQTDTPIASALRRLSAEPDLRDLPRSLEPLLRRALARDPDARPGAIDLVAELLGQEIAGLPGAEAAVRRLGGDAGFPPSWQAAPQVSAKPADPAEPPAEPHQEEAAEPCLAEPSAASVAEPAATEPTPAGKSPSPGKTPSPLGDDLPGRSARPAGRPDRRRPAVLVAVSTAVLLVVTAGIAMLINLGGGSGGALATDGPPALRSTPGTTSRQPSPSDDQTGSEDPATGALTPSSTDSLQAGSGTGDRPTGGAAGSDEPNQGARSTPPRNEPTTAQAPQPDPDGGTTSQIVYHAAGNDAGVVWFNAGTANLEKGRNSFTVKDLFCDDAWSIYAEYRYTDAQGTAHAGRVELAGDCAPVERSDSVAGPQPEIIAFRWRGCKWDTRHVSADTCEPWIASTLR